MFSARRGKSHGFEPPYRSRFKASVVEGVGEKDNRSWTLFCLDSVIDRNRWEGVIAYEIGPGHDHEEEVFDFMRSWKRR